MPADTNANGDIFGGWVMARMDQAGGIAGVERTKGRSGMVAMRVLAEQGTPPEMALETVRKARPGAVETDAQAAWAACGSGDRA